MLPRSLKVRPLDEITSHWTVLPAAFWDKRQMDGKFLESFDGDIPAHPTCTSGSRVVGSTCWF